MAYGSILLLVNVYYSKVMGVLRTILVAHAAEQPRSPSVLGSDVRESDSDVDNALGYGRRNRLQLHLKKHRHVLLLKEEGEADTPKLRDEAIAQEPDQPAVHDDTLASQLHHGVKRPRKKKEEDKRVVPAEDDAVMMDREIHKMEKESSKEKDGMSKDALSKDNDIENLLINTEYSELSSNFDQERGKDGSAPGSFEDNKKDSKRNVGMTKKKNSELKKKQLHDESDEGEQHAIARKNGRKEKDREKRNRDTPDKGDEKENWSGCICGKWKSDVWKHKSKNGKSKRSKSKGSKSKGSKGSVYHKKCMKWNCDEDIA